jgi:hypothetical protein
LREAKKVAEVDPTPVTLGFRDELSDWHVGALQTQRRGRPVEREAAKDQLADILVGEPRWQHPDLQLPTNSLTVDVLSVAFAAGFLPRREDADRVPRVDGVTSTTEGRRAATRRTALDLALNFGL